MKTKKVLFIAISIFLTATTLFAPATYGIALNLGTKQCAGYWSGDEFVTYDLPDGWKSYEFQYSKDFVITETDIGTCKVAKDEVEGFAYEKSCCAQLGYTYIVGNIGIPKITPGNLAARDAQDATIRYLRQKEMLAFVANFLIWIVPVLVVTFGVWFCLKNRRIFENKEK
jgi:hypothetical protein